MVKIWCPEIFEDRPYDPNFPIDRDLGFHWSRYLFDNQPIPSSPLSFNISEYISEFDYFEGDLIPVVSEKLKNILTNQIPDMVDFYPVQIFDNGREIEAEKFFIIKIKNEIECFDWERSNYETRILKNGIKRISAIRNLVLIEEKIKDQVIFKISEVNYFLVGLKEDLCQKILEAGVKGIEFKDLSQVLR